VPKALIVVATWVMVRACVVSEPLSSILGSTTCPPQPAESGLAGIVMKRGGPKHRGGP
jgi:hypothetical protein